MSTSDGLGTPFSFTWERLRRRLRFFSDDLLIVAVVLVLLIAFLVPSMVVTIPAGHLGVLWKRFGGGTVVNHVETEGTRLIWPWDVMYIYDARLQSAEHEYDVLSSDGLNLKVTLAWRFRVVPAYLGELHKYAGPAYAETLLAQSVAARARDVIAIYRPEDIYTSHRLEIQNQIAESVRYDIKNRFNTDSRTGQNWILIEDVLVKRIVLPEGVEEAIVRKNVARHEVEQYALIVEKEQQESERKRIEALGIRNFQEIISGGMSEAYLRWRGIEATLELARSDNAKVVVIGNDKSGGLPLISINADGPEQGTKDKKNAKDKSSAARAEIGKGDTSTELKSIGRPAGPGMGAGDKQPSSRPGPIPAPVPGAGFVPGPGPSPGLSSGPGSIPSPITMPMPEPSPVNPMH